MDFNGSHIIDSCFFGNGYSTEEVKLIFKDKRRMQRWLDVEVALLESQAELGIIPSTVVPILKKYADIEKLDIKKIINDIKDTKHSLLPLLQAWGRQVDTECSRYIHYGATTQDIEDTAQVLELREVLAIVHREMNDIIDVLADLSLKHKNTVIVGRTHGQHALPTSFGLKIAQWLDESLRNYNRLLTCQREVSVSQLFGGVGTMAAFKGKGQDLLCKFSKKLGLQVPAISWHSSRDRFAEVLFVFSSISGCFSKICNEIIQLGKNGIDELSEPFMPGQVGSSTMPHKRNPEMCEQVIALHKLIRNYSYVAAEAINLEHERDYRGIRTEWVTLTDSSIYLTCLLKSVSYILKGLVVHKDKIKRNILQSQDCIMSESLMFWLGDKMGKMVAHRYLYEICMKLAKSGGSITEKIIADFPDNEAEILKVVDPEKYLGESEIMIKKVVSKISIIKKEVL